MNEFTLEEAVSLIYRVAVLKKGMEGQQKPGITQMGHVCGLLTMNEQIEVVIKFYDDVRQFTKEEFQAEVVLLDQ